MDVVFVVAGERAGNCDELERWVSPRLRKGEDFPTYIFEQTQHLVVSRVIRDEEAQICIAQDSRDPDQASSATGYNANILPGILGALSLPVILIVEVCDSGSKRLDSCSRTILTTGHGHRNRGRSLEAAFDLIIDLWCALTEVCPFFGVVIEAVLGGLFGCPA